MHFFIFVPSLKPGKERAHRGSLRFGIEVYHGLPDMTAMFCLDLVKERIGTLRSACCMAGANLSMSCMTLNLVARLGMSCAKRRPLPPTSLRALPAN